MYPHTSAPEKHIAELEGKLVVALSERDELLEAVQLAYRKHHMGDDSIGWDELSDKLLHALDNVMGARERVEWTENLNA